MPPILDKAKSWEIYRDELERQGAALQRRLPAIAEQAEQVAQRLALDPAPLLYLTGSGDSYIAAVSCQHSYRELAGLAAWAVEAFDIEQYHAPLLGAGTLLISTSISGRTKTATASLAAARARGTPTLLITNSAGSPATFLADHVIVLDVPSIDTSGFIPSTMSYMAGMVAQHCLALALGVRLGKLSGAQAALEWTPKFNFAASGPLLAQIQQGFTDINAQLDTYRDGDGYLPYTELTDADKQQMQVTLAQLSEDIALVAGVLGLQ